MTAENLFILHKPQCILEKKTMPSGKSWNSQEEYLNLPPLIFLKLSGFQDSCMEIPKPKPNAAEIHFYCLKNSVKN